MDNTGLIAELSNRLENKAMSVIDQVKFEKEYLQYVVYVNPKVNQCFYVVTDYKTFKEVRKPYCVLKKKKKKCVNGTWQETDDLENILDEYEVIK